jgi:tRNA modification GTPase
MPIRAIDTAGLGQVKDEIEEEGHRLLLERLRQVDLLIWVFDVSRPTEPLMPGLEDFAKETPGIVALNKIDLPGSFSHEDLPSFLRTYPVVRISAKEAIGIELLLDQARDCLIGSSVADALLLTNMRHKTLLEKAVTHMRGAVSSLEQTSYVELAAADLHEALENVGELLGETISDEVLSRIFSRFCIGK